MRCFFMSYLCVLIRLSCQRTDPVFWWLLLKVSRDKAALFRSLIHLCISGRFHDFRFDGLLSCYELPAEIQEAVRYRECPALNLLRQRAYPG